ncbi:HNH endonuclease [Streptomyces sp. NBC_01498]|uniref:HNH endonuclease signature motif containing protein n=1 Tax=Streptomyces sp. NBC_01498 TaxID=2975870 RepID=UPI002E7AD209|nr:HNH endonuclease [Streptomyces sp. NBC_01498]WTL26693.1 HNH endonuclease [Streptomyces sp. NBC_01498]
MSLKYPAEVLARAAEESVSLVDLMRRVNAPLGSNTRAYLQRRLDFYGIDTSHFADESLPARERRSYSEELLREAAAQAHSIREVLEYLGFPPENSPYGHIRKQLDRFGIDTSHFVTARRHRPTTTSRAELVGAVVKSSSLAGLLRTLGIADSSTARAQLKRSLATHGIPVAHFTGQAHARGVPSARRKSAADLLVHLPPGSARTKTATLRRALDDLHVPHLCATCGIGTLWQGKRLVLQIDHVNGDRLDNRRENLRYLCPSCHSQTETHSCRASRRKPREPAPGAQVK